MTKKQNAKFFGEYWPQVCELKGWRPDDREQRLEFISIAIGLMIGSASEVDHLKDYDRLKAECLALLEPTNLSAQLRQLRQDQNRLVRKIQWIQVALLAAMEEGNCEERNASAERFVLSIMRDKFHTEDIFSISYQRQLRGQNGWIKSDLETLRDTLAARINERRHEKSLTIHQLNQLAGVRCDCKRCKMGVPPSGIWLPGRKGLWLKKAA
jgi:hypothetical protein